MGKLRSGRGRAFLWALSACGVPSPCEGLTCIFSFRLLFSPGIKIRILGLRSSLKPHSSDSHSSALSIITLHRDKFQTFSHEVTQTWKLRAGSKQETLNRWRLTGKERNAFWASCEPGRALATVSDFIWTRSTRVRCFSCRFTNNGPARSSGRLNHLVYITPVLRPKYSYYHHHHCHCYSHCYH